MLPTVIPMRSLRSVPGVCNAYLPEDTTLDRFLWVVNYFTQQGFYIILDNQFNLDQTATSNTNLWLGRVRSSLFQSKPQAACSMVSFLAYFHLTAGLAREHLRPMCPSSRL